MKKKNFKLVLEINPEYIDGDKNTGTFAGIPCMFTPPLNEDYWQFRVKVDEDQAIVGFPKFTLIGIGFAKEDDWNTNLPSTTPTNTIWNHIKANKYYASIPDTRCIKAIKMVQKAAKEYEQIQVDAENMLVLDAEPLMLNPHTNKHFTLAEFKKHCKVLKKRRLETFVNGFGTETKKRQYCIMFGQVPNKSGYKYQFTFYDFNDNFAIRKFYYKIRRYALGKDGGNERFEYFDVAKGERLNKIPISW